MTILPESNFDYTPRDFTDLRARLFKLIQTHFVDGEGRPIWTDTQAKSFGNILVELFSHDGDGLSFYRDEYTLELYIQTVAHRENMIRLVRLIGYELTGPTAATVSLKFSIAAVAAADVPIAIRTQVASAADPNIIYETTSAATIIAGNTEVSVDGEQAVSVEETVASTELPNQRHKLTGTPYLDGSLSAQDAVGTWTEVDNFLSSRPEDRHFRVEVGAFDQATSIYGDGVNGAIPTGTITHSYKRGGGTAGQVEAGALKKLFTTFTDDLGNPVSMSVINESASSGGLDRETVEQARVNAPADLRSLNRTVSRDDFETNAKRASGISRALMVTSNEVSGVEENTGKLFCVAFGTVLASGRYAPAAPTGTQLAAVETEVTVTRPDTITFTPFVFAAPFLDVNIAAIIYIEEGFTAAEVKTNVEDALADFFAVALADGTENPEIKFGWYYKNASGDFTGELAWSDVFNAIRDTAGVRKVSSSPDGLLLNGVRQGISLDAQQFPRLGTITLKDGDTGSTL